MKRVSQTLKVVLALFVGAFSNGLIPAAQASAYSTNPYGNYSKVYVCKYVGTPGADERLQTGQNPISVSKNAISNFSGLGSYFNDAQGRSYVVAWDNGDHQEPPVSMCPTPTASIPVPATPSVNDPCGSGNAVWVTPNDTAQIDWTLKANGDLVADTKTGYVFNDQTTSHNYGKAVDSNIACTVPIPVPATPSVNDPCGLGNAVWNEPQDTAQIDWVLQANGDLVANAKAGYEFATGNKTSHNYGKAVDSGTLCVISTPQKPEPEDPCGPRNAHWVLPDDTDSIDWSLNHYDELIATAKPGYKFSNGKTVINFGKAIDSNTPCVVVIPVPKAPEVKDPCGLHNAQWVVPHDTMQVDWSQNYKGELIATAKSGYIFANEQHSYNFGKAVDSGKLCPAKPETPKFIDYCGTRTDYVVIPSVKGVTYKIDGVRVSAGYRAVSGAVTVTAVPADEDYVLVGDEKGPWTHEFTEADCVTITKSSQPVTDTNGDGAIGVGDVVTWNITVTNNSDNDFDNFRIELNDNSATILDNEYVVDGVIKYLKHSTSVSVTATSKLTVDDIKVCKATNIVTFQGWYTRKHHKIDRNGHDENNFSLRYNENDSDEEDEYDINGTSNTATAEFTCPTPGSGSGGETVSEETPTVLPSTGPSDSNPLLILAGSAIAYLATYCIQRRRELTTTN